VGQADSLPPPFRRRFGCVQLLGGTGGFACLSGFLQLLPQAAGVRSAPVQQVVIIKVDAATKQGPYKPIFSYFSYFGYDEPNYTYMKYGPKLVGELAALSYVPVYIRAHHLLCTGRWNRRTQMGIDQRLHRGLERQAYL